MGLDVDAKVRQKSNRVLATLLTAIDLQTGSSGKKTILTPFLKDLLAVWMVCQFDTHRDVVRVAKVNGVLGF